MVTQVGNEDTSGGPDSDGAKTYYGGHWQVRLFRKQETVVSTAYTRYDLDIRRRQVVEECHSPSGCSARIAGGCGNGFD